MRTDLRSFSISACTTVLALLAWAPVAFGQSPDSPTASAPRADGPRTFEDALLAELRAKVALIPQTESLTAAYKEFEQLFDLAIAFGDLERRPDVLIALASWRRLIGQLATLDPELRASVKPVLLANPLTARTLAMTIGNKDKAADVYRIFAKLAEDPRRVQDASGLANLVAAVCVVHDQPLYPPRQREGLTPSQIRLIEKYRAAVRSLEPIERASVVGQPGLPPATAIDPVAVFNYFAANAERMNFPIKDFPPELLSFIVDSRASVEELRWAYKKYAGDPFIGRLYHTIVYDTNSLKYGHEKKIWQAEGGYTLQNLLAVGGTCGEQAYFTA